MSLKEDLKAASVAVEKLQTYCRGLPKNSAPTAKYYELNTKADKAIRKLPRGLQSQFVMDLASFLK